jgi:hypothetical protein
MIRLPFVLSPARYHASEEVLNPSTLAQHRSSRLAMIVLKIIDLHRHLHGSRPRPVHPESIDALTTIPQPTPSKWIKVAPRQNAEPGMTLSRTLDSGSTNQPLALQRRR